MVDLCAGKLWFAAAPAPPRQRRNRLLPEPRLVSLLPFDILFKLLLIASLPPGACLSFWSRMMYFDRTPVKVMMLRLLYMRPDRTEPQRRVSGISEHPHHSRQTAVKEATWRFPLHACLSKVLSLCSTFSSYGRNTMPGNKRFVSKAVCSAIKIHALFRP